MTDEGRKADAVASERRLRELLTHAWERSPFYREIYAARGIRRRDLPHVALEDLPVVSKADLMVRFDEAVTDPRLRKAELELWLRNDVDPLNLYLDTYIIVHGSGGTKIYSYVPYTRETWRRIMASVAPLLLPLEQSVATPLRSAFYFWTEGHYVGATNAKFASRTAHDVLSLSVFDPEEEVCARLNAFRPERLHSYASALSWLAEWTLEGKLRIAPRAVLASGDRLTPAIRAQIKAAWNAEIYDLYGACESLCMAVQRPGENVYEVLTESNLLEVVDAANRMVQPGARGRVLLTSLVNATLPIIRFDLHDYAVLGSVGAGAATLGRLEGKTYHALPVRLTDGSSGALEVYELARLELPGIAKIQFVAHDLAEVEIRYQSAHDQDAQIDAAFRRLLVEKSAVVEKVTIRRVGQIPNSLPAFKLQCVVEPGQATFAPASLAEEEGSDARQPTVRASPAPSIPEADSAGSIDQRVGEIAARHPRQAAAVDGKRRLSYGQLDRLAGRVAGELLHRGFDSSRPVAVLCAHRLELLPLVLGVLRAGGFYLPLDPKLPRERLRSILSETHPQFLLSSPGQARAARALAGNSTTALRLEDMNARLPSRTSPRRPTAPACLLYTSGSTGAPKGVLLSLETIRARAARYAADYGLGPADRMALLQSYSVSAGIREIFGALLSGATLALYDVRARGVAGIARWLNECRITVLYAVPTLFRSFLETLGTEVFPSVRVVRLGGEALQAEDVDGFRRHFSPQCQLANGYASTETDTICQYVMDHGTRIVAGRVPAGTPIAGADVAIRDGHGNAVVGELGEICVAGKMLAAGYWDAARGEVQPLDVPFATGDLGYRLPDGRVFLAGRRDLMVKIHGYRIDLGEIERVAGAVPGIAEAAAVVRPAERNNSRIVVFYASAGNRGRLAALRRAVACVVPERTVSTAFVRLPALPRLPGGKVNRSSLPAHPTSAAKRNPKGSGYASETEAVLANVWQEVLGVHAVTRGDGFFDLGGDSIAVFRVLGRIKRDFGVDLPVGEFFANVRLSELARAIDARVDRERTGSRSGPS